MAHSNVDAFRRGADALNRGDVEVIINGAHADLVLEPRRTATEGAFLGHEGIRRFLADTATTFELFQVDYTDIRDIDVDRVLAIGTIRVRGAGSGVETDIPTAVIAEYRDGLTWRFKDYGEAQLALEAAGLSE